MQSIHSIEYELTSALATDIQHTLARWEWRRGWRRDLPLFTGAVLFALLIVSLALKELILPAVAGGLLFLEALFVMGAVFRRWSITHTATVTAVLALHSSDRRVRIDFDNERMRMETEFFRGEGAWTELDEVVIFHDFWVLRLSNGGQMVLPTSSLSAELDVFIRAKAQQVEAPFRRG